MYCIYVGIGQKKSSILNIQTLFPLLSTSKIRHQHNFQYNILKSNYTTSARPLGSLLNVFHHKIRKVVDFRQKIYDKATLYILTLKGMRSLILLYHKSLFYFRYSCENAVKFIENYMTINFFALLLSIICSRLHIAGYLIIVCLILIRLDFMTLSMLRFYKPRLNLLVTNFPQINQPNKRPMWTSAMKAAGEAASNPHVQAVGVAVAGALAWKTLDVYDTLKQENIATADREATAIQAQADREATAIQAQADREATAIQAQADREATTIQAQADREATAIQAQADRDAENRRHKETLDFEREERAKDREAEDRRHKDIKSSEKILH